MKLLESKKLRLPKVFFITDREEIKDVPIGVPFIYGDLENEPYLVKILEYEVLYQEAIKSGFPFNFKKILKDNGFLDLEDFGYGNPIYMDYVTEGMISEDFDVAELKTLKEGGKQFKQYVKDSAVYVDIEKLKELHVFPVWLDKIEDAINTNIHNFAVFNENLYNKKLEGMYGGMELTSPGRNLIIIDISGSIPRGVSSTCLTLAKNLCESFYADILITGTISTLYSYENIHELDITSIYETNGMDNDQSYFKGLLISEEKKYQTAIVFGDNDHPGSTWNYSTDTYISDADGKKLCKWEIEKLISFHTHGTKDLAGYSRWFEPKEEERIADWVKYL
jgi:hypothetical protein